MICKHCGARIERGTMLCLNLGTGGSWLPPSSGGSTVYFADGPSSECAHEPEAASVDTTGAAANRRAIVTYPTGSMGEYLPGDA